MTTKCAKKGDLCLCLMVQEINLSEGSQNVWISKILTYLFFIQFKFIVWEKYLSFSDNKENDLFFKKMDYTWKIYTYLIWHLILMQFFSRWIVTLELDVGCQWISSISYSFQVKPDFSKNGGGGSLLDLIQLYHVMPSLALYITTHLYECLNLIFTLILLLYCIF